MANRSDAEEIVGVDYNSIDAIRVADQAVASRHMREDVMVASDYAIKTIGLISGGGIKVITSEREWQLKELKKFLQP